jgi:uncharacterized membrane protein YeaQ/YmgE (transglycosylase-associated protein family)
MWTILVFVVIGMVAGWAASLLIRRDMHPTDWGVLFIIGILGSLIAGILVNLVMGDGFRVRPGGVIGSIAVSCLLLWIYTRVQNRGHEQHRSATTATTATTASGAHRERKGGKKHHSKR